MGSALVHSNIKSKRNYNYNYNESSESSDELNENENYKNYKKKVRYDNNSKIITVLNTNGTIREFKTIKHNNLN